jgi:hypothetical protein
MRDGERLLVEILRIKGVVSMKTVLTKLGVMCATLALVCTINNAFAEDDVIKFRSPSKNIYCIGVNSESEGGSVDCEIITRTNAKDLRPRPADCDLEWGNRFAVYSDGKAAMICAGDTLRESGAFTLGYGEGIDRFGIHCTSTEQGIECINDDQHGFKISKGKQKIY